MDYRNRCALCVEDGTYVDEVSGTRFCERHAGPLSMSDHDVDQYSLALRIHGYYDTPCRLPGQAERAA